MASIRLKRIQHHINPKEDVFASIDYNKAFLHHLNPTFFLPRSATIQPNAPAILHFSRTNKTVSRNYAEFSQRTRNLAFYLRGEHGRVAVLAPNTPMVLEAYFAISAANRISVVINYRLSKEEVLWILSHADCTLCIVDEEYMHLIEGWNGQILVDSDHDGRSGPYEQALLEGSKVIGDWDDLSIHDYPEHETISISYTSGTTSNPKGVKLTHRGVYLAALANIIESHLNCENAIGEDGCKYLWTLPMFHAVGWTFPWAITAVRGLHVTVRKVEYGKIWQLLKEHGITHFNAAPTVNTNLCAHPEAIRLPQEVRVTVAASPPSPTLFERMIALNLIPIHVYGLTETYGPAVKSYYNPEWNTLPTVERFQRMARQGHGWLVGKAVRVVRMTGDDLVNVTKDGKEIGEIVFQGNSNMSGYLDAKRATDAAFAGNYFRAGDLAVWHPDSTIEVVDRKKDMFISGGENVSSIDVENAIMAHPAVLEAAVVGIPDEKWGEVGRVFLTLKQKGVQMSVLEEWLKSRIAGYKIPKEFVIVQDLPKNGTNKVMKTKLRELKVVDGVVIAKGD